MSRLIDLTGRRFGRLEVINRAENDHNGKSRWICVCDCGNEIVTTGNLLRRGKTKSCGCLHSDITRALGLGRKGHHMQGKMR